MVHYEVKGIKNGVEVSYTREDITKGYYLYKSLKKEGEIENLSLIEVSPNDRIVLRGYGMTPIIEEKKPKKTNTEKKVCGDWFEQFFGISREEYNDSLKNFARLHGTTLDAWGIDEI